LQQGKEEENLQPLKGVELKATYPDSYLNTRSADCKLKRVSGKLFYSGNE